MPVVPGGSDLLSVAESCAELGGIGRSTLYRLIHQGQLIPVQVAGRTFFLRKDVESLKTRKRGLRRRRNPHDPLARTG
jgi:excisionase family DNA binding protein